MVINPGSEGKPTVYEDVLSWADECMVAFQGEVGRRDMLLLKQLFWAGRSSIMQIYGGRGWNKLLDVGCVRRLNAAGRHE